jgi:competence protein ComEC
VGDLGFQLSFAATLGILAFTRPLLHGVPSLPLRLDLALAGSLAAQLALLPLLAAQFQRLAPAALLLNLAAVPLSGAVLLAGLGVLAAAAVVPALAGAVGDVAWVLAHALLRSADLVRFLPALDVRVPPPPAWAVGVHVLGLLLLVRGGRRRAALPLAIALAGVVAGRAAPADGRLHMAVLDVGQGDAIVLHGPSGRVWVVDAGAASDRGLNLGESVVGPYLRQSGVRRIDRLLVTHAHPDHAGGAPFLLRSFTVGDAWEGPAPRADATYHQLRAALAASGAARRTVTRGVREGWDGVDVEVLSPARLPRAPWRVRNDDSVVVALRFGETRLLLAGDVEGSAESSMAPWPAAVIKVPHHGSRSSSTPAFVEVVGPRLAVISAGYRNHFGHPHAEVVERYRRLGAEVLRTDVDGAITVSTDGHRLWVQTARDPRERRVR